MNNNQKAPSRVYIPREMEESIGDIKKEKFFEDAQNKHIYLLALSIGFKNNKKSKFEKRHEFVRLGTFNEKEKALIKSIAISDYGGLEILSNKKEVYEISEKYAATGLKILKEKVLTSSLGSYEKTIEAELIRNYDEIEKEIDII